MMLVQWIITIIIINGNHYLHHQQDYHHHYQWVQSHHQLAIDPVAAGDSLKAVPIGGSIALNQYVKLQTIINTLTERER